MAKKKPSAASTAGKSKKATPAALRRDRERAERDLIALLNRHATLTEKLCVLDPTARIVSHADRENLAGTSKGPLSESTILRILHELQSAAAQLVQPTRVAYLGPPYSYTHLAAENHFGGGVEMVAVATISAVFEEVQQQRATYGVVPLENSTDGRVVDTLDMFARQPSTICAEIQLPIHHNLLARCDRSEIREVYSKPQALSQCRDWIAKHLPGVRPIEMTSTAAAAQLAADRHGAAAVASHVAADHYGLDIIAANIEDREHNVTRFAIIGDAETKRTGKDKTALMFEIAHKPGSLADTMTIFKRAAVNLTWIESFPKPGEASEYLFFVELQGHKSDARVKKALTSLGRKAVRLEILGSYPRSQVID